MTVRSVVVLPAPFRPTRQTSAPGSHLERHVPQDVARLDEDVDAVESQHQSPDPPRAPTAGSRPTTAATIASSAAQPVGRGIGQDPALLESDDPVGVAEDDVHVVLDQQDRLDADATRGPDEHLHHRGLVAGRHAARRLVEQDRPPGGGRTRRRRRGASCPPAAACGPAAWSFSASPKSSATCSASRRTSRSRRERARGTGGPRPSRETTAAWRVSQDGQVREDLDQLEAPRQAEPREPDRADPPDVAPLEAHGARASGGAARSAR